MSGYSGFEQAIGSLLDRAPRLKGAVENAYQRANYYLFVNRSFTHEVHEDATLYRAGDLFGPSGDHPDDVDRFVGFYDISPWDDGMDRFLLHELEGGGNASIVVLGEDGAKTVAETEAWNYQQGSRTQWHPTREDAILYNDLSDGRGVARLVDTSGDLLRTYDRPIQAANPIADEFVALDYRRLDHNSPGYGYGTATDPAELADADDDGLFRVTGDGSTTLVVSFADLQSLDGSSDTSEPHPGAVPHERHHLHHVVYAPNGERFAFLHRWTTGDRERTRLVVAERTGNPRVLLTDPYLSHFSWLDERRLVLWGRTDAGRGYYVVDTDNGKTTPIERLGGNGDGHPSVAPGGRWVVTDTYPDRSRIRHLSLYDRAERRTIELGSFLAPFRFDGPRRCDLHPRWSPDGRFVSIDSAHEGHRGSYVLDVSPIVD